MRSEISYVFKIWGGSEIWQGSNILNGSDCVWTYLNYFPQNFANIYVYQKMSLSKKKHQDLNEKF